MKRAFIFLALILLWPSPFATAQDATNPPPAGAVSVSASDAASVAAREAADERAKRTAADIEALQSANDALQAKLTAMEQEIQTLREAQTRAADNSGLQDTLKTLAEKIQEVDKKREADNAAISEEIRKSIGGLEKTLGNSAPSPHNPVRTPPGTDSPAAGKGYSYTIQEGDSLWAVVKAYNTDFKSKGLKAISSRQVREANPNVDWNRLRVGQKIVVPMPDGG